MAAHQLDIPQSFDGEVRLFPLPNLVMLPSNVLPLHIFESRYWEMLEDAMRGDQLITMATLSSGSGHDYYSRPPVAPVVCIGRGTAHGRTEQGTYNLMLVGLRRALSQTSVARRCSFMTIARQRTRGPKLAS